LGVHPHNGPESARFQEWKQSGDALLAEREAARKSKASEPETTESEPPENETAEIQS